MSVEIFFTLDSEPNNDPPEFTLTCRSEGGPVTTVMWEKDGIPLHENISYTTSQIITNTSSNTVYYNTLSIKGREYGTYNCTVNNNFINDTNNTSLTGDIIVKSKSSSNCSYH